VSKHHGQGSRARDYWRLGELVAVHPQYNDLARNGEVFLSGSTYLEEKQMPSFEADVVLRALIVDRVQATIGPDYLGPSACRQFAEKIDVDEHMLWGAICSLRESGRVETIRVPSSPGLMVLIPTHAGQRYFDNSLNKQPYPRERCRRGRRTSSQTIFAAS